MYVFKPCAKYQIDCVLQLAQSIFMENVHFEPYQIQTHPYIYTQYTNIYILPT